MLVDDASADPQSQPCTAHSLGGEEGLKDLGLDFGRDTWAVVPYVYGCAGLGAEGSRPVAGGLRRDADPYLSPAARSLCGVCDEVGEDLAELSGEAVHLNRLGQLGV